MPTRLVENRKFFQSVDQESREKLDFKAITFRFFQGDFLPQRSVRPQIEKFINHVPLLIEKRARFRAAGQRGEEIGIQHSVLVVMNPEVLQRNQRDVPLSGLSGNSGKPSIRRKRFPGWRDLRKRSA